MGASLGVFICAILDYLSVEFYYQIATVIITASNIFPGKLLVWLIVYYLCSMVVDWIVPYSVIDHLYLCQANSCNSSIESNGVSGHYFQRYFLLFWHERAAFQLSAFGRSTAGNDVVATIFIRIFFPPHFFLRRDLFS